MAIYTKRGDKGKTSLYDKASARFLRVSKDSLKIDALGVFDELNSFLGVTLSFSNLPEISQHIKEIQRNLLTIGSITAGSKIKFSSLQTKKLEKVIGKIEKEIPVLTNFILPGGTVVASHLQYARSIARKAERNMITLSKRGSVKPQILAYINRLSDFLFVLARFVNFQAGVNEEVWLGNKKRQIL